MVRHNTLIKLLIILSVLTFSTEGYSADKPERLFSDANSLYKALLKDPDKSANVEIWQKLADAFYGIFKSYNNSKNAPTSLFLSGKLYEKMGYKFNNRDYLRKSVQVSRELTIFYPKSNYADDAQIRIARITEGWDKTQAFIEYDKILNEFAGGDMVYAATKKVKQLDKYKPKGYSYLKNKRKTTITSQSEIKNTKGLSKVKNIRNFSLRDYTRVVIDLEGQKRYKSHLLKPDPKHGKPPRLFVDIDGTYIDPNMKIPSLEEGLLEQIRFARYTDKKVRVVLDINSFEKYNVFHLQNPFRIVMDIYGDKSKSPHIPKPGYSPPKELPDEDLTIADALGLKIRRVVIDPGHGGHDPGAIGPSGLKEKDVNLKIAKALKAKLQKDGKKYGIEHVSLTRDKDRFIRLEDRTTIAQKKDADLFISIHCNAAKSKNAYGIETYILSLTKDKRALEVAARENALSTQDISDMENIIKKIVNNAKIDESKELASHVQNSIVTKVNKKYSKVKNKGVKKAPFMVLIGADVPSILVESSFITNPREEKRLKNKNYIDKIADGIFAGVVEYSKGMQTAYAK
ncbi:MAG: N-acetylmuramoyl-L-alanine amidase [Candidatus Dadabacteria bacterium]|nr:N-acetylmuramoyl-L-alanine amidase [Candidatus Dadabacteria bacterium]NIS10204.1 N-acetylmuramoyl-L-alanine amidase [Candidatus Dadabacteria bacterium]NIV42639.1 AMIN domain-containing protein [Candidatus Dadabacteria bacterium]NIX16570.1 AMIN domain-containing protein [Candidatus Dadabacteria bacterium]NIY23119.1 AMIN domain-containing protein [Candidatus Dadabacteria bacterium]